MDKLKILLFLSIFVFGVAVGFYASNIWQNNLEVLVPAALVLALLTWLGTGADFLGLLREIYNERRQKERIPIFEPKGCYKNSQGMYFLRIQKVKGEDMGEGAIGYYTIKGNPHFQCTNCMGT